MNALVLCLSLLAQTTTPYQLRVFQADEANDGTLSPAQLTCVGSFLPVMFPAENAADFLGVRYAREDQDRANACVTFDVERSEPSTEFVLRTRDTTPGGAWFSSDGTTSYWSERLQRMCVPRGQLAGLVNCLSAFSSVPGQVTLFDVRRSRSDVSPVLAYLWERVTGSAQEYALARRDGTARPHTTELDPEPEGVP